MIANASISLSSDSTPDAGQYCYSPPSVMQKADSLWRTDH